MSAGRLSSSEILQKIDELPTLPTIVYELNKIISDPMSSTSDVESVMENDPSLTTRVLKLVNSAYYAIPGGVSNLSRAIAYLGFDTVHQLVLSATIIETLSSNQPAGEFDVSKFWQHSMGVAMAAETLGKHLEKPNHADFFTCGLLHDIGKMALYLIDPETLQMISKNAIDKDVNMAQSEAELGTVSHAHLGLLLTKKWQLPTKIQISAQYHHQYDHNRRPGVSSELGETVDVIVLSNLLVHALKFGESGHRKILPAPKELLMRLHVQPTEINDLVKKIRESLASADSFLKIIGGN
jgi:putative nucleotidyltransferase with HDIG domain